MSRIHEALKKAEQERTTAESIPQIVADQVVVDAMAGSESVIPARSAISSAAPTVAMPPDAFVARSRQTNWQPHPKTMLFFSREEHLYGMEEFRTLRSRLYQAREKHPL